MAQYATRKAVGRVAIFSFKGKRSWKVSFTIPFQNRWKNTPSKIKMMFKVNTYCKYDYLVLVAWSFCIDGIKKCIK